MANETPEIRFSEAGDKALSDLYARFGSNQTVEQQINVLEKELGHVQVYATGGNVSDEMRLSCLEFEWLTATGLLEVQLA